MLHLITPQTDLQLLADTLPFLQPTELQSICIGGASIPPSLIHPSLPSLVLPPSVSIHPPLPPALPFPPPSPLAAACLQVI